jgi:membrane protease YdiL (CAAX protease family)
MKTWWLLLSALLFLVIYQVLQLNVGLHPLLLAVYGYIAVFLLIRIAGLDLKQLGLSKKQLRAALPWSLTVVVVIVTMLVVVYQFVPDQFADERYNLSLVNALFVSLVVLPLKTVLLEELFFRGFLYSFLLKQTSDRLATFGASVLFGLWHLGTASGVSLGFLYIFGLGDIATAVTTIGVVLVTSFAGYIFVELRKRSGSILTPIVAHWAINGTAILLAAHSLR